MDIYQRTYLWASLSPRLTGNPKPDRLKFHPKNKGLNQLKQTTKHKAKKAER